MHTIICPFCKEVIKEGAVKCKHCGSILSQLPIYNNQNVDTIIKQELSNHYQIISALGKGGMATVYKAIQKNLNRYVALKVVHPNLVHDQEFLARFHREAQVSASLRHPNIVTIYDVGSIKGIHFISMELLDGKDLHSIIRSEGKLTPSDLVLTIAPIANALGYAHEKHLVHRDIKSSNIFITKEGRPVLTDFGIAHLEQNTQLTQAGAILGTPDYMSPEQANAENIDGRSDIFSLGVVMYECLTGQLPFKTENPLSTINAIINKKHKPVSHFNKGIPNWIEDCSNMCLEKNPDLRPKTAYDLELLLKNGDKKVFLAKRNLFNTKVVNSAVIALSSVALLIFVTLIAIGFLIKSDASVTTPKALVNQSDIKNEPILEISNKGTDLLIVTGNEVDSTRGKVGGLTTTNDDPQPKDEDKKESVVKVEKNLEYFINQANTAFDKRSYQKCLNQCIEALTLDPDNKTALKLKEKATKAIEDSKILKGLKFDKLVELADYHYLESNSDSALFFYQQARKYKPNDDHVNGRIIQLSEELSYVKEKLNQDIVKANEAIAGGDLERAFDLFSKAFKEGYQSFDLRDQISKIKENLAQYWINEAQNKMVMVDGGIFEMGSDQSSQDQKPKHQVQVSSFQMDAYEVTVEEYRRFCKINGLKMPTEPSKGWSANQPIVNISWNEAMRYAQWVGKRLPTEAEWEYAAKGGRVSKSYKYSGSDIANQVAWYNTSSIHTIKSKNPNELGLYDMSGNVWEWCYDFYDAEFYKNSSSNNPLGPQSGDKKIIRGGGYKSPTRELQVKHRGAEKPQKRSVEIGFRCVKSN
ncbi:SUMF1/EgtB/PvdO family nonheme iron enzyme [Carboxylicivirga caseinilyticus]|uniref:SUMF1/EgtB/PvdO family nonheme iron enzyme n=1 Tax=Carboxylicivirga caseinilyticus TaxID=3417572 RepID=UPI003D3373A0|nr:SUMF1/EgtB/PvdO family nonheme iron enzyme [Marinilabiliaceae bacterium A049]